MENHFYISTDKRILNVDFVHENIQNSYWGKERSRAQTLKTIENSYCFSVYTNSNEQIGFARVVTDTVFFGYIMDVIIITNKWQERGLGKKLVDFILNDEMIKNLQTIALKTKDAHSLYEKYGFSKIGNSPLYMSIDKQILD